MQTPEFLLESSPHELDIRPSTGIDLPRRRSLFRLGGGVAVHGAEKSGGVNVDLSYAEELGVDTLLDDYTEHWNQYSAEVEEFIVDESNRELFGRVAASKSQQSVGSNDRNKNANARNFTDMVVSYVMVGRTTLSAKDELSQDINNGVAGRDVLRDANDARKAVTRIGGKLRGLVDNFNPSTEDGEELLARLGALKETVAKIYSKTIKIENKIIEELTRQARGSTSANMLINSFIEASTSEAQGDRTFVKFLSTLYSLSPKHSVISEAIDTVKSQIEQGSVASSFVEARRQENDGDNQLNFFGKVLEEQGIAEDFAKYLSVRFDEWPADMKRDYTTFSKQFVTTMGTTVHRIAAQNTEKLWVRPTLAMAETFIDDLFQRTHGNYKDRSLRLGNNHREQSIRGAVQLSVTATDVIPKVDYRPESIKEKPKELGVIVRGMDGVVWKTEGLKTEAVVAGFINPRRVGRKYFEEVLKMVERLKTDPFGEGIQKLRLGKRRQGSTSFYRVNPVHLDMGVKAAKSARIIFTVEGDKLGVYSITSDHQDYEQVVAGISGSSM